MTILAVLVVAPSGVLSAQELSDEDFPSEDEILLALEAGEISWQEYLVLMELAQNGIDSTNQYLLDEIPNLSYFWRTAGTDLTDEEKQQQRGFQALEPPSAISVLSYRIYRRLQEDGPYSYLSSAKFKFRERWSIGLKTDRTISGREQFRERFVRYQDSRGLLRQLHIGSFNMRFGLGAAIGYRGQLFENSRTLDGESFLFPSYGGFNGMAVTLAPGAWRVNALESLQRDALYRMQTTAVFVEKDIGPVEAGCGFAYTLLNNRRTEARFDDFKLSWHARYAYSGGYTETEIVGQNSDTGRSAAIVMEGRHRYEGGAIRYSGWVYGDRYVDLTSGSKTARLYRSLELSEPSFEYRSRRSGQIGGLVRTVLSLSRSLDFDNSILAARINDDTMLVQAATGLEHRLNSGSALRIEFMKYLERHRSEAGDKRYDRNRFKTEMRIKAGRFQWRAYIAYTDRESNVNFWSIFCETDLAANQLGKFRIWINFSRLDDEAVDYSYLFVSNETDVNDNLELQTKLAFRYSRSASEKYQPAATLKLTARL